MEKASLGLDLNATGQPRPPMPRRLEDIYETDDELMLARYAESIRNYSVDRNNNPAEGGRFKINSLTQFYTYTPGVCTKCGVEEDIQFHHIVYTKGSGLKHPIVPLCRKCHSKITSINTRAVHILHKYKKWEPLTDEQRIFLFNKVFMFYKFERRLPKSVIKTILINNGFLFTDRTISIKR